MIDMQGQHLHIPNIKKLPRFASCDMTVVTENGC